MKSMPAEIDFSAEDEPTMVLNGSTLKRIYDQQAPAPDDKLENTQVTPDHAAR